MATLRDAPWQKAQPKRPKSAQTKLTAQSRAWAKARANKAGRRYPNLVDNMAAARRQTAPARGRSADHP